VSGTTYVAPPVTKKIKIKHNYVHNQIANKSKTNDQHMGRIIDSKVFNASKHKILRQLHNNCIEFRHMTAFKNALFDSEILEDKHLLPVEEWERIRKYETHDLLDPVNQALLDELVVKSKGGPDDKMLNLQKFMDLLDLYTLLPMKKDMVINSSENIYQVLSSNTVSGHTWKPTDSGGSLGKMLDLLWIKLDERFKNMADAFRYFDRNYNNRVSFGEFQKALDHMRIKY